MNHLHTVARNFLGTFFPVKLINGVFILCRLKPYSMVVVENVWQFPQIKIDFSWKAAIPMSLVNDGNSELIIRQTTTLKLSSENVDVRQFLKKSMCHVQVRITDEEKKVKKELTHSMQT